MANAKTYNELNQASAVNASDKVALAQENKTELVTTTVKDLADAVGELNQAGALAEISLATSIGKNLLAQRLNEKGVQNITPNNTLIEMADAVDELQVTNSANLLKSRFFLGVENTPSKNKLGYALFAWCDLGTGYTAVVATDTIYIFKKQGDYSSLPDAINHAEMSLPLTTVPTNSRGCCYMTSSQDGKTLIVTGVDTSDTVDIYSIDYETKTISFVKNITVQRYSDQYLGLAISNDQKLISIFSAWDSTYRIYSVDDTSKYATVYVRPVVNCIAGFAEDNRTLWLDKNAHNVASSSYAITKISCTLSDSGDVSATIDLKQQYMYDDNYVVLEKHSMLFLKTSYSGTVDITSGTSSTYQGIVSTRKMSIADTRQNDISFVDVLTYFTSNIYYSSATVSEDTIIINDCIKDANAYKITLLYPYLDFTYTISDNKVAITNSTIYTKTPSFISINAAFNALYYNNDSSILIAPSSEYLTGDTTNWYGAYVYKITNISDEKLAGLKWTINGRDSYFVRYNFSDADIDAGRYDFTTKQIEIK